MPRSFLRVNPATQVQEVALPAIDIACLLGVAARDFSEESMLSMIGIGILLTGWSLLRLGRGLFRAGSNP